MKMRPRWARASTVLSRLRRPAPIALTVLAVAAGLVVVAAREEGFAAKAMDLGSGSVWVSSNGPGQMALLDGASAEVTVKMRVSNDGEDVLAVQGAGSGYAVNRSNGTILRVDAATWNISPANVLIDGSTNGLTAIASDRALYVTDVARGLAVRADPRTLLTDGGTRSLSALPGPGSPVLDGLGTLWMLDSVTGNLIRMTDTPETTETAIADGARGRLVLANDQPVVVDLAARKATPIDPRSGTAETDRCVDTDGSDHTLKVLGSTSSNQIYTVSGASGVLRITDLDTGDCTGAITDVATPGADLGQPVEAAGRVFVPNYSTGEVIVVDLEKRTSLATTSLVDPGTPFDLLGQDGFAFYNDRGSNKAGVINTDGNVRSVAKYEVDDPGKGLHEPKPPEPDQPGGQTIPTPTDATGTTPPAGQTQLTPTADAGIDDRNPNDQGSDPDGPVVVTSTRQFDTTGPISSPSPATTPTTSGSASTSTAVSSPSAATIVTGTTQTSGSSAVTTRTTETTAETTETTTPIDVETTADEQHIRIDSINIKSFPNDGQFLSGDNLTIDASISGDPVSWFWTLRRATDDGRPVGSVEETSTNASFGFSASSVGSAAQSWIVDLIVADEEGVDSESRVFVVKIVDGRPFEVTAVNVTPNPVITGQPVRVSPSIQGPRFTCNWSIRQNENTVAGPVNCDEALTAPAVGSYNAVVSAISRQNTPATGSASLTVKNIDPPTVSACSVPAQVNALQRVVIAASTPDAVTGWHWAISRGNPPVATGPTGTDPEQFAFTPTSLGAHRAEVWVTNAGGDSPHQTCDFTVVDPTPPEHSITMIPSGTSGPPGIKVSLSATDPESPVTASSMDVTFTIVKGCNGGTSTEHRTATSTTGFVSVQFTGGTCHLTSPGGPLHEFENDSVTVAQVKSSATSAGGTANWTD